MVSYFYETWACEHFHIKKAILLWLHQISFDSTILQLKTTNRKVAWSVRFTWLQVLCCMRSSLEITPRPPHPPSQGFEVKSAKNVNINWQHNAKADGIFMFWSIHPVGLCLAIYIYSFLCGRKRNSYLSCHFLTSDRKSFFPSGRKRVKCFFCFLTCSAVNRRRQLPENSVRQGILFLLFPEGPGTTIKSFLDYL